MQVSKIGIEFIKHFEHAHDGNLTKAGLQPKMDPIGIWTVGYGHALVNKITKKYLKGQKDFKLVESQYPEFLNMTLVQASLLLEEDLKKEELKITKNVSVPLEQHQFEALASYCYNVGQSSTLWSLINTKASEDRIQKWFETHYISANGENLPGLVRRRKAEAYLYKTGKVDYFEV